MFYFIAYITCVIICKSIECSCKTFFPIKSDSSGTAGYLAIFMNLAKIKALDLGLLPDLDLDLQRPIYRSHEIFSNCPPYLKSQKRP